MEWYVHPISMFIMIYHSYFFHSNKIRNSSKCQNNTDSVLNILPRRWGKKSNQCNMLVAWWYIRNLSSTLEVILYEYRQHISVARQHLYLPDALITAVYNVQILWMKCWTESDPWSSEVFIYLLAQDENHEVDSQPAEQVRELIRPFLGN